MATVQPVPAKRPFPPGAIPAPSRPGDRSPALDNEEEEEEEESLPPEIVEKNQRLGLDMIRDTIKTRTIYDALPVSFRLILLDTNLLVKKALHCLIQNNIVSAPLWNSQESTFAGLLTASDFINVIKYYYQKSSLSYAEAIDHISKLKLHGLRDVERSIGASPPETLSIDPQKSLYDACQKMLTSRARRIPLIEGDTVTKREAVISVMTQYRILKFVAVNLARWTNLLQKKIGDLKLGTYDGIATASMETTIFDVISLMSEKGVASIPIVDENGIVLNVYEAVDVLALIQDETYDNLRLMVKDALFLRSDAEFEGVFTCTTDDTLDFLFETIRRARLHRFVIVNDNKRLIGMLTLSDILGYLLYGELAGEGGLESKITVPRSQSRT